MTIYATPFTVSGLKFTGPSVDSGFACIDDVVAAMGKPLSRPTPRYAIYGDNENRIMFSRDLTFYVDDTSNIN